MTSARSRARQRQFSLTGGGGGGPAPSGVLTWGPRFGINRDDAFRARGRALPTYDVKYTSTQLPRAAALRDYLPVLRYPQGVHNAVDLYSLDLQGSKTCGCFQTRSGSQVEFFYDGADAGWVDVFTLDESAPDTYRPGTSTIEGLRGADLLNNRRRGVILYDFTGINTTGNGQSQVNDKLRFNARYSNSPVSPNTMDLEVELYTSSSDPRNSTSPTWNTEGDDGNLQGGFLRATRSFTIDTNYQDYDFTLNSTQSSALEGNWAWFLFTGSPNAAQSTNLAAIRPAQTDLTFTLDFF